MRIAPDVAGRVARDFDGGFDVGSEASCPHPGPRLRRCDVRAIGLRFTIPISRRRGARPGGKRPVDFFMDVDAFENRWPPRWHVVDATLARRGFSPRVAEHLGGLGVVHSLIDFVGEEIAGGALDETGLLEDADWRGLLARRASISSSA